MASFDLKTLNKIFLKKNRIFLMQVNFKTSRCRSTSRLPVTISSCKKSEKLHLMIFLKFEKSRFRPILGQKIPDILQKNRTPSFFKFGDTLKSCREILFGKKLRANGQRDGGCFIGLNFVSAKKLRRANWSPQCKLR